MTSLVSELTGADLALWVAKCDPRCVGLTFERRGNHAVGIADGVVCIAIYDGTIQQRIKLRHDYRDVEYYAPHEDWQQGGPIIRRANIGISPPTSPVHRCGGPNAGHGQSKAWTACTWTRGLDGRRSIGMHDTSPLIAAMRCFVRSVYGETVTDEVSC